MNYYVFFQYYSYPIAGPLRLEFPSGDESEADESSLLRLLNLSSKHFPQFLYSLKNFPSNPSQADFVKM